MIYFHLLTERKTSEVVDIFVGKGLMNLFSSVKLVTRRCDVSSAFLTKKEGLECPGGVLPYIDKRHVPRSRVLFFVSVSLDQGLILLF